MSEVFLYKSRLHLLAGREEGFVSDDGKARASGYDFLVGRGTSRHMRFLVVESEERGMCLIEVRANEEGGRIGRGRHHIGLHEGRV